MDSIIKTNYGVKKIPPCFGSMNIRNPNEVPRDVTYDTPGEMEEVKRRYSLAIRSALAQAEMCNTCYLFDKCAKITSIMLQRKELKSE
jgi:hypothetical protein